MLLHMKDSQWTKLNAFFCRKDSFLTDRHCQPLCVSQDMKHTLQALIDPAIVLSMFMLSFMFVIVCILYVGKRIFALVFFSRTWKQRIHLVLHEKLLCEVCLIWIYEEGGDKNDWVGNCLTPTQQLFNNVCGLTCRPTRTHYSDSEPTSFCSFSLMLCA